MKRKKRSRGWRRGNLTRGRCNRAGAARSRQGPQNAGEETGAVGLPTPHGIHRKRGYGMFSEILRSLRKAKGLTQRELAGHLGVTQQMVAKWEKGQSTPGPDQLTRMAELLEVSTDTLLGRVVGLETRPASAYGQCRIPVVGTVKAGYGALAFEEDYGSEYASVKDPDSYFYLVVRGDSMEPRIQDGDLALVHRQPVLDSGDLGVLIYGEGEGTLKRYVRRGNAVVLQPFNPDYEELVLRGEELEQLHVVGKVIKTVTQW